MKLIRIIYGTPYQSDPDYDGTITEETDIHGASQLERYHY